MNQNGATVKLTDLTEGQYRFKLTVNGTSSYGEGFANVTVLPPQRINTPPMVVITPQAQTVKLPNTMAVLDGSASKVSINNILNLSRLVCNLINYEYHICRSNICPWGSKPHFLHPTLQPSPLKKNTIVVLMSC